MSYPNSNNKNLFKNSGQSPKLSPNINTNFNNSNFNNNPMSPNLSPNSGSYMNDGRVSPRNSGLYNNQMNQMNMNQMNQNKYPNPSVNGMGYNTHGPSPQYQGGRKTQGNPNPNPPPKKFLPFQPPRISSQPKYYQNSASPTNYQNMNNTNRRTSIGSQSSNMSHNSQSPQNDEIARLQEKLKETLKINNMATVQINQLNQKAAKYDELRKKYESVKKENSELLEKMESQQISFASKNNLIEQKLKESKDNLMALLDVKLELDQSKNNVESLKKTLKKTTEKMNELKESMNQIQKEKEDRENEIQQLREEMKQKDVDINQQIEQQKLESNQNYENYENEIQGYKNQVNEYLTKIKSLENLVKEQEDQIEVYKISEGDLTNLKKEFNQNLAQFEIKDKSIEEKTKQLNESLAEIEELRRTLAEKEEILNSYKKNAVENDYLKGILEKKDAEIEEMTKKQDDLETANKNLQSQYEEEKQKIQEKIENLEKENEELQRINNEHDQTIRDCRDESEKKIKEMETMEKTLTETQEKLDQEKKAVLSIQSEYNNCQGMYNQAMEAIKKLEDTQTLLQKQLEGSKIKSDEMAKNYEESQNILQQKATEKQQLTQEKEEYVAAKEEEVRKMKEEFVESIESLKAQYVEVKVYNDFLRKEIRKLKGIPEDILTEEMHNEELESNKYLYKQIENQRIQIENLKEQLELSLNL